LYHNILLPFLKL